MSAFDAIESSNIPSRQKSTLRRWADSVRGGGMASFKTHAGSVAHGVRQGGTALVVGAGLGYVKAVRPDGLDVRVQGKDVPLDGLGGALAIAASVATAGEEYSTDLRNLGSDAIAICAFRKTDDFVLARRAAGAPAAPVAPAAAATPAVAGDYGEDPIVAAARAL